MVENERWKLMSKLAQFADVLFPDLKPNSYDNLNNMKLYLNVSTPQGQSILVQITRAFRCLALVYKLGLLQVSCKCFSQHSLRETHLGICKNRIFCTWARLFVSLVSYFPTVTLLMYSRSYQMLDPLWMVEKLIQICKDREWTLDSKNKMWLPS